MPKSAKSQPAAAAPEGPSFEEAYAELEGLVREMESDEMPLAGLIESYERGIRLHAVCQQRLEEAQGRIESIRRRANGETVREPFDENTAAAAPDSASSLSLRNDAELF